MLTAFLHVTRILTKLLTALEYIFCVDKKDNVTKRKTITFGGSRL